MKTVSRGAAVLLTIIFGVFVGAAQDPALNSALRAKDEKLPPLLRPSDYAIYRAKEMGGEAFMLLSGDFPDPTGLKAYYYPFQGCYSFKDHLHGVDQIGFLRGNLTVGNAWSYGFFADLGIQDFREVDRNSQEVAYFLSYKPPRLDADILSEIERLREINVDGLKMTRSAAAHVGHTYLLRSIDYINGYDIAVVLSVAEVVPSGPITIFWKKLALFQPPIKLFMTDEEMQRKVDAVVSELGIPGLRVKVEDNKILVINGKAGPDFEKLKAALHKRNIPYRALGYLSAP